MIRSKINFYRIIHARDTNIIPEECAVDSRVIERGLAGKNAGAEIISNCCKYKWPSVFKRIN